MELINNMQRPTLYFCEECGNPKKEMVNMNGYKYCADCLAKALLMIRPIEFDKFGHHKYLQEWIKPFLESK